MSDTVLLVLTATIAALGLIGFPLVEGRRAILGLQLLIGVAFASHYALLGVTAAVIVNVLGCVQVVLSLWSERWPGFLVIGYALIPAMGLAAVLTWSGPITALAALAMAAIALGRMAKDELSMRLLLMVGGSLWFAHDLMIEAWIIACVDVTSIALGVLAISHRWRVVGPAV